jgi:polyketide biosynthesis acyl carrier protein
MAMNESRELAALLRNLGAVMPDLDLREVSVACSLADLGCNSIDRMDIVAMTMEDLGIAIPVTEFKDVHDISSLMQLLQKHVEAQSSQA